ncbi:MAG: iron-sulfur cluster assembly scaffold protein [Candidatus Korobacteraceae bacterium]
MTGNAWRGKLLVRHSAPMYSPQLLDHFERPRNSGELPDADAQVRVENPACGDILELAIKMNAGRIGEIRFRAKGCVAAMACASAMTELAKGRSRQEAIAIDKAEILSAVGGVPPASGHAAQLAVDALREALHKLP